MRLFPAFLCLWSLNLNPAFAKYEPRKLDPPESAFGQESNSRTDMTFRFTFSGVTGAAVDLRYTRFVRIHRAHADSATYEAGVRRFVRAGRSSRTGCRRHHKFPSDSARANHLRQPEDHLRMHG